MILRTKTVLVTLLVALLLSLAFFVFRWSQLPTETTKIRGFSAPFVFGRFSIPEGNPLTEEAFHLGRRLFYDPLLSGNNEVSCASCHLQELAFTDGLAKSVGISGEELSFSSMTLTNLMWGQRRFFWNGRTETLEEQALIPIQHKDEMGQDLDELLKELKASEEYRTQFHAAYGGISTNNVAKALSTFMRLLVSSNSKYDQYLRGELKLSSAEELGRKLFMAHPDVKVSLRGGNCIDCHSQFLTSGFKDKFDGFSNNGLDSGENLPDGLMATTNDPAHRGLFKVPTLRNIAVTGPYMHDGRFKTLEDVMTHYNSGIKVSETLSPLILEADNDKGNPDQTRGLNMSDDEVSAIVAFLHTLTDQEFLTNPKFSNPFDQ